MTNHSNSPWTDELRAEVKEMWSDHSAQEIAVVLQNRGYRFTRNSIVGLLHRAGLTIEQKSEARKRRPPAPKRERKTRPVLRLVGASSAGGPIFKTVMIPDLELACADIVPRNVTLLELGRDECRYPYGDGPFLFCGHQTDGSSYCAGHKALCYVAPQKRWRDAA
jgi:GcrA cell cycle regulator